jgi:hypothetical protein
MSAGRVLSGRAGLCGGIAAMILAAGGCASAPPSSVSERAAATSTPVARAAATETATAAPAKRKRRNQELASRVATTTPTPTPAPTFVRCDANIRVRAATTTCGFAQNVFYAFYMDADAVADSNAIEAYSPASKRSYALSCRTDDFDAIRCVADDGGEVRFDLDSLLAYDDEQAAHYARTHDLGPDQPDSSSNSDYGVPDDSAADYGSGDEIPNYDEGRGYRVRCADGMYSKSGGIQGACSYHGGVADGPSTTSSGPSYGDSSPSSGGTVHVHGYYRKDGTYVHSYTRRAPCSYC